MKVIDTGLLISSLIVIAQHFGIKIFNGVEVTNLDVSGNKPQIQINYRVCRTGKVIVATNGFAKIYFPKGM